MVVQLDEVRSVLKRARQAAAEGDAGEVLSGLDAALAMLRPDPLLTTVAAAAVIGIQAEEIVKGWCRQGKLRCERDGDTLLIPLSEAERFRETREAAAMRWSDAVHDATAMLGSDGPMTEEELAVLSESRRGLPIMVADDAPDEEV